MATLKIKIEPFKGNPGPSNEILVNESFFSVLLERGAATAENCTFIVQSNATEIKSHSTYIICPSSAKICRIRFDFVVSYFIYIEGRQS